MVAGVTRAKRASPVHAQADQSLLGNCTVLVATTVTRLETRCCSYKRLYSKAVGEWRLVRKAESNYKLMIWREDAVVEMVVETRMEMYSRRALNACTVYSRDNIK